MVTSCTTRQTLDLTSGDYLMCRNVYKASFETVNLVAFLSHTHTHTIKKTINDTVSHLDTRQEIKYFSFTDRLPIHQKLPSPIV